MTAGSLRLSYTGPNPLIATESRHHPCTIRLLSKTGLEPDSVVQLLVDPFRGLLDAQWWDQIVFVAVEPVGVVVTERRPPSGLAIFDAITDHGHLLFRGRLPEGLPRNGWIDVRLGIRPSPHAGIDLQLRAEHSRPDGGFLAAMDELTVPVIAGPPEGLECRGRRIGDSVVLSVFATDRYANPATSYDQEVTIDAVKAPLHVRAGHGVTTVPVPVDASDTLRIEVRDRERAWSATSPPLRLDRPYFGDLHFHTSFSPDGGGDLRNAYSYSRDVLQLDLAAVTDHTPVDYWQRTADINEQFNESGRFVTVPAWEWSTAEGHANVYLRSPDIAAGPRAAADTTHPYRRDWPDGALIIPHHTNTDSSYDDPDGSAPASWFPYDWSVRNPAIRLVELVQCRGNFEADELDPDWGIVTAGFGASVQDALDRGYRIGFVGGTDNHSSAPTRDSLQPGSYAALTGIYPTELSREAIWDAMWERRTFATSGVPIIGWVRIGGVDMGSELAGHDGSTLALDGEFHGTAPIERIEVISSRRVVWSTRPRQLDVELAGIELPATESRSDWYYVRLLQRDGHRAWFSPVWVDREG